MHDGKCFITWMRLCILLHGTGVGRKQRNMEESEHDAESGNSEKERDSDQPSPRRAENTSNLCYHRHNNQNVKQNRESFDLFTFYTLIFDVLLDT